MEQATDRLSQLQARQKLIQRAIVDPLTLELLSGVYRDGDTVYVNVAGDELVLK